MSRSRDGTGPDKKVSGRKRGLAVDVLGLIIGVVVPAASVHDKAAGTALIDPADGRCGIRLEKALVDRGFEDEVLSSTVPRWTPRSRSSATAPQTRAKAASRNRIRATGLTTWGANLTSTQREAPISTDVDVGQRVDVAPEGTVVAARPQRRGVAPHPDQPLRRLRSRNHGLRGRSAVISSRRRVTVGSASERWIA
ncbi:transposase [Streptomyces sp. 2131.1]|uniref:transposase n=1 Tax=Streptomyces sp. 2131.1 TaxID=1855346 RepID=UPI0035258B0A